MSVRRSKILAQQALQRKATAKKDDAPAKLQTFAKFQLFPKLPVELRNMVWGAAARDTPVTGVCLLDLEEKSDGTVIYEPLKVYPPRDKRIAASCQEARDVALKTQPARNYNPKTDILYLSHKAFQRFTSSLCGRCELPWAAAVRHLAITMDVVDAGLSLPIALGHMRALETLAIVYPQTSGEVDCFTEVPNPQEPGARLRLFTEEEMKDLTITADYVYDTWFAPFPISWSLPVQKHVEYAECELNKQCRPGNARPVPSLWDYQNNRLNLTYRAMCFTS